MRDERVHPPRRPHAAIVVEKPLGDGNEFPGAARAAGEREHDHLLAIKQSLCVADFNPLNVRRVIVVVRDRQVSTVISERGSRENDDHDRTWCIARGESAPATTRVDVVADPSSPDETPADPAPRFGREWLPQAM